MDFDVNKTSRNRIATVNINQSGSLFDTYRSKNNSLGIYDIVSSLKKEDEYSGYEEFNASQNQTQSSAQLSEEDQQQSLEELIAQLSKIARPTVMRKEQGWGFIQNSSRLGQHTASVEIDPEKFRTIRTITNINADTLLGRSSRTEFN